MRVEGKVAVVTGAASGIGRATAELLVREGARVVVADRDGAGAASVASALGGKVVAAAADVSKDADARGMVQIAVERFGRLDILVNNAGYGFTGNVVSIAEDDWDRLMSVNLKGVFLCSKHASR